MREARPWPPIVAMTALVALLVMAYLARDAGPTLLRIAPATARPGDTITLRYTGPWTSLFLTFERDGRLWSLANGTWTEIRDSVGWFVNDGGNQASLTEEELTLPLTVAPGRYRVCSLGTEAAHPTLDEVKDLDTYQRCAVLSVVTVWHGPQN